MNRYSDTMENLEDGLEADQNKVENKPSQGSYELLVTVANLEFIITEKAIKKLQSDISGLADSSLTLAGKSLYDAQIERKVNTCNDYQ